jgi:FkbH-like protein
MIGAVWETAMIETLPETPTSADLRLPVEVAEGFAAFREALRGRSQIVWGEHCSECAYPSCYAHCAFYTPRSDFNCRRFEAGFESLTADPALHRVRFRKWGKLEGRGTAAVAPIEVAATNARRDALFAAVIAKAPAPYVLKRKAAWKWNQHKSVAKSASNLAADAFVVEIWACDGERHPFTLTILNTDGDHGGRMFQTRFEADAGYRCMTVSVADIAARVDLSAPFLVQIEPVGEAEGVQVVFGVCDFVTLPRAVSDAAANGAVAAPVKPAKVVVWDLDETVWTGVLVEDGVAGVHPRPEAVAAIKMLDERGVLQSVASKNSAAEAIAALKAFGLADYFLHPQIHWSPKSGSLATLAKALNLGLDSFVFIDDQPFERAEVTASHPVVRVLAHTDVGSLPTHSWFDLPVTAESRQRRALYQEEAHRIEASEIAGADYGAFLRGSEIKLSVDRLAPSDVERVFELSQRTNQLNFTGRKYTREAVRALLALKAGEAGFVLRCSDRFGDYGLIAFAVVDFSKGLVSELFMSCRVQRKRVEHAFMAWLAGEIAVHGGETLRIAFLPTPRNGAAREMLDGLGFKPLTPTAPDHVEAVWARSVAAPIEDADVVAVLAPSAARAA